MTVRRLTVSPQQYESPRRDVSRLLRSQQGFVVSITYTQVPAIEKGKIVSFSFTIKQTEAEFEGTFGLGEDLEFRPPIDQLNGGPKTIRVTMTQFKDLVAQKKDYFQASL